MNTKLRPIIFILFIFLAGFSIYSSTKLKYSFAIEQFFPEGDEDLIFFQDFIEDFESDLNFLFVAIERKEGVFEKEFLEKFHALTLQSRKLPHVANSHSLTTFSYPIRTPFTFTSIPAIHIKDTLQYASDKKRILRDPRLVNNLISADGNAMVVAIKSKNDINFKESNEFIEAVDSLIKSFNFGTYHLLGPAYFQKEMVAMQKREILVSVIISAVLVSIVMWWIFRRIRGIGVALVSIGLGMLLFMGFLGAAGRQLNAMSALYPVIMIIVGTSDVIHIMSKYIDELRKGVERRAAIFTTVREIGLATLLTSITTAIGFASLMTSRVGPIQDFGLNAAMGVMIAFSTVILFTTVALSYFNTQQLIKLGKGQLFWEWSMLQMYTFTRHYPRQIALGAFTLTCICLWGISMITTNYQLKDNLPKGAKISQDFHFFEKNFVGFMPMEIAVFAQGEYEAGDYEVLMEMNKVERYMDQLPSLHAITSATALYKSANQMYKGNRADAYKMPSNKAQFIKYKKITDKIPALSNHILLSKDGKKARITSRIHDLGADSIQIVGDQLSSWIEENTNSSIARFKLTGTSLIMDKNADYIRHNLLQGLGIAIIVVSLLMAILFRNASMIVISLIPNILPLLIAGAFLGFLGIELEAGISIIFAVIFGIAVDDTIHFLSKYKLARAAGKPLEEALKITFVETGKAICLTSFILFFGFLIMLFSIHPPSVTVGFIISLTLVSALFADLLLIPVMIRWWHKA